MRGENQRKIGEFLPKCYKHFQLAARHIESNSNEIAWQCFYFLAKVAEKLRQPPEIVQSLNFLYWWLAAPPNILKGFRV